MKQRGTCQFNLISLCSFSTVLHPSFAFSLLPSILGSVYPSLLLPLPLPILQGLKARNFIHSKIEENIKKKVQESNGGSSHRDALQQLIDSSRKNGEPLSMQVRPQAHTMQHVVLVISCWVSHSLTHSCVCPSVSRPLRSLPQSCFLEAMKPQPVRPPLSSCSWA